jgi:hypothetical protein
MPCLRQSFSVFARRCFSWSLALGILRKEHFAERFSLMPVSCRICLFSESVKLPNVSSPANHL